MGKGPSFHSCTESRVLTDLALTVIPLYFLIITLHLLCKLIPISIQTCRRRFYDKRNSFTFPSFIPPSSYYSIFVFPLEKSSLKAYPFLIWAFIPVTQMKLLCQGFHWLPCYQVLSPHFTRPQWHWNRPLHPSWSTFFAWLLQYHPFLVFLHLPGHSVVSFTDSSLSFLTSNYWWVPELNSWASSLLRQFLGNPNQSHCFYYHLYSDGS